MKIHAMSTERQWRNDGKGAHVSQMPSREWGYLLRRPEPLSTHEAIAEHLEATREDEHDHVALKRHFADVAEARRCFHVRLTQAEAAWMGARMRQDGPEDHHDWLTDPLLPAKAARAERLRKQRVTQRMEAAATAKRTTTVRDLMASPARARTYGLA